MKPVLRSGVRLIHYADNALLCFRDQSDAQRVYQVLGKRFGKYGLTLHAGKTRLLDFPPPAMREESARETFNSLGFTHYQGRTRTGGWNRRLEPQAQDRRQTSAPQVQEIGEWCRKNRHRPISGQQAELRQPEAKPTALWQNNKVASGRSGSSEERFFIINEIRFLVIDGLHHFMGRCPVHGRNPCLEVVEFDEFKASVIGFTNGGKAFHPIPGIQIVDAIDHLVSGGVDVTTDDPHAVLADGKVAQGGLVTEGRRAAALPPQVAKAWPLGGH